MLCYAFKSLNKETYERVSSENFEKIADLFSQILILGLNKQIKQGLMRDYIEIDENISSLKGKINIKESINSLSFLKNQLNCTYDEFLINSYPNRIIKTTLNILLKSEIETKRKSQIRKILIYFREVDTLDVKTINWKIRYDRNNQDYQMLIGICYLALNGLLQTEEDGVLKLMSFSEDSMNRLYERFIFNYYKIEHPQITVKAPYLKWPLDSEDYDEDKLLPRMETDIELSLGDKFLIIDAKYHNEIFLMRYGKRSIRSDHLYQIFTYVKSKEFELREYSDIMISGMLLYAGTEEDTQPDVDYNMLGNIISVKTLDLNQDFDSIKSQLDKIVTNFFVN